ncbi:MAG: glycosyltransferase [Lachnospiraceae bacterium]|nr:glycosyltransferase [Lachnospiraceae bacterium]
MEEKKISVISIIYQVEPYLPECLDSLAAQTYRNLEFLLVVGLKDGANDACLEICERYAKKDERFRVIPCPAKGIADARNVGLSHVSGDLIAFVDGDDYVDADFSSSLICQMEEGKSAIAVCGRYYEFRNKSEKDPAGECVILTDEDAMRMILTGTGFFLHLWDKLFVRALFDGVTFPTDHVVEDRIMVNRLLAKAGRISYDSTPKYHFRERSGSNSKRAGMAMHNAQANRALCDFIRENYPSLTPEADRFYLQESITSLQNLLAAEGGGKEDVDRMVCEIRAAADALKGIPCSGTLKVKTFLALHARFLLSLITKRHQKRDGEEKIRYE